MRRSMFLLLSGLSIAVATPISAFAEPPVTARPSALDPYGEHITEAAQRFELPAAWIRAVMRAESDGNPRATSPKGAMGLMQVMPETWAELRVRHRLGDNAYDPHDNIIAGAAYIRDLFDRYGSPGWIAAYNAGPGRYEASLKGRPLPAETRAYVAAIAPALGDDGDRVSVAIATIDPPEWTRAPLFTAQPDRSPAVDPMSATGASTASTVRDVSAIAPRSDGLFVARAAERAVR